MPRRSTDTGRGPLEALSMGVDLAPGDVAYRCNLVTVEDNTMVDFSAGHISSEEGAELLASLQGEIPEVLLKAGVSLPQPARCPRRAWVSLDSPS